MTWFSCAQHCYHHVTWHDDDDLAICCNCRRMFSMKKLRKTLKHFVEGQPYQAMKVRCRIDG